MDVWVLERDLYEQRWVAGVYATAEAAMAAAGGNWEQDGDRWFNDLDWSAAAAATRFEVQA